MIITPLNDTKASPDKAPNLVSPDLTVSALCIQAGPRSAVGSASDSRAKGLGFNTRSGHILSFLLPLVQERQLSVTSESMCTKYWLTA